VFADYTVVVRGRNLTWYKLEVDVEPTKLEDTKTVRSIESWGHNGSQGYNHFFGSVQVKCEEFDELSDEEKKNISHKVSQYLESLHEEIMKAHKRQTNPAARINYAEKLASIFETAGFEVPYLKIVDNEYSNSYHYYDQPWVTLYTDKGPIKVGWRKRVIHLEWDQLHINMYADEIFPKEKTTKGPYHIHCWGEDKLSEYAKQLAAISTPRIIGGV